MSVSQQLYAHAVFADNFVSPVLFQSVAMYFTDLGQIIEKNLDVGQARFFCFGLVVQCFCCRFAFVCQNMAALSLLQVSHQFVKTCRSHSNFVLMLCLRITLSGQFCFTQLPCTLLILLQIIEKNIDVGQAWFFRFVSVMECFCCRFGPVCQNM